MAVLVTPLSSKLKLQFAIGEDEKGNPLYRSKTLSRVKTDAENQDLLDVALALGELIADPLEIVNRIDDSDLVEDA